MDRRSPQKKRCHKPQLSLASSSVCAHVHCRSSFRIRAHKTETLRLLSPPMRRLFRHVYALKTRHQFLGRYSVDKLAAFEEYQRSASLGRVMSVIVFIPLLPLFCVFALEVVPFENPLDGANRNWQSTLRTAMSHFLLVISILQAVRQGLNLHVTRGLPTWKVVAIAASTSIGLELFWLPFAFYWRYPIPLREFTGLVPFGVVLVLSVALFAREEAYRYRLQLRAYIPLLAMELTSFYFFVGLSSVFPHLQSEYQILLILVTPILKVFLKHRIWKFASTLDDISTDVTICLVEMSGSLYMTVCMQFAKSKGLGVFVMVLDLFQALFEVHMYIAHEYSAAGRNSIGTAVKITATTVKASVHMLQAERSVPDTENARRQSIGSDAKQNPAEIAASREFARPKIKPSRRRPRPRPQAVRHPAPPSVLIQPRESAGGDESDDFHDLGMPPATSAIKPRSKSRRYHMLDELVMSFFKYEHSVGDNTAEQLPRDEADPNVGVPKQAQRRSGRLSSASVVVPTDAASGELANKTVVVEKPENNDNTSASPSPEDRERALTQTLELLFSCEVLLFAEYVEVVMPLIYGFYITGAWYQPSQPYNLLVRDMTASQVHSSLLSSVAYAALETLSFVVLAVLMRRRYGHSTLHQLAFVLETYWRTIQGKILGCFITVVLSAQIHQGTDFSFRFDFASMMMAPHNATTTATGVMVNGTL
ncbi:hypothetical protein PINS_up000965 [Pythium insidiosum]|nr:hypothetical protein PINS_up000965 [Pythium insidiosum]